MRTLSQERTLHPFRSFERAHGSRRGGLPKKGGLPPLYELGFDVYELAWHITRGKFVHLVESPGAKSFTC